VADLLGEDSGLEHSGHIKKRSTGLLMALIRGWDKSCQPSKHENQLRKSNMYYLDPATISGWIALFYLQNERMPTPKDAAVFNVDQDGNLFDTGEKWGKVYSALYSGKRGVGPKQTFIKAVLGEYVKQLQTDGQLPAYIHNTSIGFSDSAVKTTAKNIEDGVEKPVLNNKIIARWLAVNFLLHGKMPPIDGGTVYDLDKDGNLFDTGETFRKLTSSLSYGLRGLGRWQTFVSVLMEEFIENLQKDGQLLKVPFRVASARKSQASRPRGLEKK